MKDKIRRIITESIKAKELLSDSEASNIEDSVRMIAGSLKSGGKLILFGNGGSAADSQHIAAELVGRFGKERKALAAIALTTNTSTITALANDYGYKSVFARQLEALGAKNDVAMAISTSGNSENVIEAAKKAKAIGMKVIGLLGSGGGKLKKECDISIVVPVKETPRIQESHIMIGHIICGLIEEELFGK